MGDQTTRLYACVGLILGIVALGFIYNHSVSAANQAEVAFVSYMPIVPVQPKSTSGDLTISHIGLYQSVQNQFNDVPLVARKPALLRVFANSSNTGEAGNNSFVTVEAYRNGQYLGSLNSDPMLVPASAVADRMDSTFNLILPDEWLEGKITLVVRIDQPDEIREENETNNSFEGTFVFRSVPALDLVIVPITYKDTVTGVTFQKAGHDPISQWLLSAFPISEINVTIHDQVLFTGDLRKGDEWGRLLQEMTDLWAREAGPGSARIYYGLVPNSNPSGGSWFTGGISGLGWIGQRVSVGIDAGSGTAAAAGHEIGHNFGRRHAPCGNPGGVDPHYPYPNASIGVYGIDTSGEMLLSPNTTHDMMSYCGPEWVSDYTYEGLLLDQSLRGKQSVTDNPESGLLVTARLEGGKIVSHNVSMIDQPYYATDDKRAQYEVRLIGRSGAVVATYPVELYRAEEEGVTAEMLVGYFPLPVTRENIAGVQFLSGGSVLTEELPLDTD